MKNFYILIFIFFIHTSIVYSADTLSVKNKDVKISAIKIDSSIKVDGKLDESEWEKALPFNKFIQKDPDEGKNPSEKTEIYFLYDENALYVGAIMYDSSPDSIISRLTRRDEYVSADQIVIFLDPYFDRRSGYFFSVNAAGTLSDGVLYNDTWDDDSWDAVWEAKAHHNGKGWTAEMKIPFSQLKFHNNGDNIWGINVRRDIARKNERDYLVYVPKTENGFVSHFAQLVGLKNINPPGRVEILPYFTTRAEFLSHEDGDPFNDGSEYTPGVGVDLRMGIGSNLTLNATVNPDFGQVEIDPAVINLSDVETFFSEKRPFFIEGSTVFRFGRGGANNYWGFNWSNPDFFYSRRIGRVPQGSTTDNDFLNYPDGTHILGAAKLTGNLGDNFNFGTIQAVTDREFAEIQYEGNRSKLEVEPLTYYGIFRMQKEFNEGNQAIGFISTSTIRSFDDNRLRDEINSQAFTFGLDGWTFLDSSKSWVLTGWTGVSHISGTEDRITDIQRNSRHYFQRPDATHVNVDSSANSLTGYAGRFYLNKQKGNFFFNSAFGFITPEFDVNDVGFMWRADAINFHIGGGYQWTDPTNWYRYTEIGGAVFRNYDFGGNITWEGIFHFGYMQFLNYYSINWNLAYNPETISNNRTRGGPLSLNPSGYQADLYASSDSRKDFVVDFNIGTYQTEYDGNWYIGTGFEFRPLSNLSVSFNPSFNKNIENTQYVDVISDQTAAKTFGKRYVFGELEQSTISASIRLNWTFTPELSLQLYMQPLISSGNYKNFKELKEPGTYNYLVYGEEGSTFDRETYTADPDGEGPADSFEIDNPAFNFKSLRGNAVLRWEYLPGSVLYFVWTQTRSDFEEIGEFRFNRSFSRLVDATPDNIFMVKFTYWFNM